MLPNAKAVVSVAETVTELNDEVPLVVDPVLVSTSGDKLADESVVDAMLTTLFPLATLVTPNLQEASVLLGMYFFICLFSSRSKYYDKCRACL